VPGGDGKTPPQLLGRVLSVGEGSSLTLLFRGSLESMYLDERRSPLIRFNRTTGQACEYTWFSLVRDVVLTCMVIAAVVALFRPDIFGFDCKVIKPPTPTAGEDFECR